MDLQQQLTNAHLSIGRMFVRLEDLEKDNAALRARNQFLQEQVSGTRQGGEQPKDYPSPATSSNDEAEAAEGRNMKEKHEVLARKYADLQASHASLQSEHDTCYQQIEDAKAKAEAARTKAVEYKNGAKAWKAYAEHQDRQRKSSSASKTTQTDRVHQNSIEKTGDQSGKEGAFADAAEACTTGIPTRTHNERDDSNVAGDLPSDLPQAHDQTDEDEHPKEPQSPNPRVPSSQTTIVPSSDDDPKQSNQNGMSSDFEPIFVSARCLKRKRGRSPAGTPPRRIKQEHQSPINIIELSSDPAAAAGLAHQSSVTSIYSDLDRPLIPIITPRRPRRVQDLQITATSEEAIRPMPRLYRNSSSRSDGDLVDQASRFEPDEPGSNRRATGLSHRKGACATEQPSHPERLSDRCTTGALQQISPNVPIVPRSKDAAAKAKPKPKRTGPASHAKLLSEASDISSQVSSRRSKPQPVFAAEAEDQLEDMLNEPATERTPTLLKKQPQRNQQAATSTHLPTPVSGVKRRSPLKRRSPVKGNNESPPRIDPEDEPLRLRDVRSLKVDDFKINSKYQGTDFAFADTLRGRDQRRGLHACTRADCCGGALAKVIAMGGNALSGKTDEQALDTYLGPQWRDIFSKFSAQKRKETITQAHAHCFANQHGKHRQAFERRSTPPGFWRTDFPTTQEEEEDRKKAQEMERRTVEDRYREAIAGGGRWIFRDE
ncbi:hypothetical protein HII31_04919 [Pseudocercospora fuligena]|uniref:DNA endonuclease activator Ctp1 C-terminal domain-containing protein n=1 Tax=Pseudocercospora fuligena TaxID=685502 RepID=A0A8H6VKI6_9PEZI|nr:hypothetical protein HII31_04919 [Pseudocercospora fuligena]